MEQSLSVCSVFHHIRTQPEAERVLALYSWLPQPPELCANKLLQNDPVLDIQL